MRMHHAFLCGLYSIRLFECFLLFSKIPFISSLGEQYLFPTNNVYRAEAFCCARAKASLAFNTRNRFPPRILKISSSENPLFNKR